MRLKAVKLRSPLKTKMDISQLETLVFSGGGVRGISYIGVILAFQDTYAKSMNEHFQRFVGTSVGALFALFCAINVDFSNLIETFQSIGLSVIFEKDPIWLLTNFALSDGHTVQALLVSVLESKGFKSNVTFGELFKLTNKHLVATTVDLNTANVMYLDHIKYPDIPIVKGIMGSMALPPIFPPVVHASWSFIDGGLLDAFPIALFDPLKTLGIHTAWYIDPNSPTKDINSYYTRILAILQLPLFESQEANLECPWTVYIDLGNINADTVTVEPKELVFKGYRCAIARFASSNVKSNFQSPRKYLGSALR